MKILVTNPIGTIARTMHSHKAAQAAMYADILQYFNPTDDTNTEVHLDVNNSNLDDYEFLFFYHGNDFSGGLNLFGGVENYSGIFKITDISRYKGNTYSIRHPMPRYSQLFQDRLKNINDETALWNKVDWESLAKLEENTLTWSYQTYGGFGPSRWVVGDSHCICMYRPGWMVHSIPYKTLNGALKEGLKTFIPDYCKEELEFYFGNIDIRHHVCRLGDTKTLVEKLCDEYVRQVFEIGSKREVKVSIYELLPIETESRIIPRSGWYKGQSFWGSWEERNQARIHFRDYMKTICPNNGITFKLWTDYLLDEHGQLDIQKMEKPRSVHLSREFYPYWQGWKWNGIDRDDINRTIGEIPRTQATLENFLS